MNMNPRESVAWVLVGIQAVLLTGTLVIITMSVCKHNSADSDDLPKLECKMDDNPCYELPNKNFTKTGVQEIPVYDTVQESNYV